MKASHRIHAAGGTLAGFTPILCAFALAAASMAAAGDAREVLGPSDTVRITVFQNPDLGGELRLSERGTVVLPLIGEIALAGQTPVAAGTAIATRLAKGHYLVDPQVSVSLVAVRSRQVSVLGHVVHPGQYPLDSPGLKLTDILALAGGVSESGDSRVIAIVTRDAGPQRLVIDVAAMYLSGDMTPNIELQGGDAIFVPEAPVFYVYGEVQRAGAYRLEPNTLVMGAIAIGGGLTARGTRRGLTIHRRLPDGTIHKLDAGLADVVVAGDVIHVSEGLF